MWRLISQLGSRPDQAPETLVHFAVATLLEDTRRDAQALRDTRPGATPAQLSTEVTERAVRRATVQGAIAGTPLYLVLLPAYLAVLLEQARMVLTIAALHDAAADRIDATADLLTLTMIHPSPAQARQEVEASLTEDDPPTHRRRRRAWLDVGRALLILTNLITPRELTSTRGRLKTAAVSVMGLLAFVLTFIFSVFSILALAWASQSTTDALGCRARRYYGDADAVSTVSTLRRRTWQILLVVFAVLPVVLLVVGIKSHPHGLRFTHVLFFFVALALVIAAFRRLLPKRNRAS